MCHYIFLLVQIIWNNISKSTNIEASQKINYHVKVIIVHTKM